MYQPTRRDFLRTATAAAAAAVAGGILLDRLPPGTASAALPDVPLGVRATQDASVQILNPLGRVPLSFIIDDSTCLVNMGHFCMPQFATAWPQRFEYKRPWKDWPREIPDAFVREFGEWCATHGVRGKYSIVPYPACVGWLDRDLPGWSKRELQDSLKLVRELMVPNWDITPEMITHTRAIDLKTGRPLEPMGQATMENSYPQDKKSVDELAAYIAYALRILKNCELPCEGVTTPGGFGNVMKAELSLAVGQAVSDVYAPEIPFYFKYIAEERESVLPQLEHVEQTAGQAPKLIVNVPAGTGDWMGGWDGSLPPTGEKYANDDATAGRMVELIERGEPAVMFCHWAGLYGNGSKRGFEAFKKAAAAIETRFGDRTVWMKSSEMARYWAAKGLTKITRPVGGFEAGVVFDAPLAAPGFTVRLKSTAVAPPRLSQAGKPIALAEVKQAKDVKAGTWRRDGEHVVVCYDLPRGESSLIA